MLQPIPGGAAARPFVTHHNALDMKLYLRIAPELYLKRLVVGGFERSTRSTGTSATKVSRRATIPSSRCSSSMRRIADYRFLMEFTEEMFRAVAERVLGTTKFMYQGRELDFSKPFGGSPSSQAIRKYHPDLDRWELGDREFLVGQARHR